MWGLAGRDHRCPNAGLQTPTPHWAPRSTASGPSEGGASVWAEGHALTNTRSPPPGILGPEGQRFLFQGPSLPSSEKSTWDESARGASGPQESDTSQGASSWATRGMLCPSPVLPALISSPNRGAPVK